MALDTAPAPTDKDLASVQEARALARRARAAQLVLAEFPQEKIDRIVDAMAAAVAPQAEALARLAVEETGYGVVADKVQKNRFSAERVHAFIRPMRTVGVVARDEARKVIDIAEPFGVVAAIVPSTNPTSTAIYKILIALKARCAIVLSPHPAAVRCISRTAEIMADAAKEAGAPPDVVLWMKTVSLEGTQELMKAREVAVILATGGMGLVRAAYSAGKPAYGVGPGNAPAYIERSADVAKAVRDIVTGKTFDNGVLCSSENSVVVDEAIESAARDAFKQNGAYFLSNAEADAVARVLVSPQRLPNPALVGRTATFIAEKAGIKVPPETRVLIAQLEGVGRDYPLSIEKLCPVLSYYIVKDWHEGCERCMQILRYGGMGHTMSIHSQNEQVILEFGLKKPAFRIVVNTPTTHGSIGLTTGLDPAMTLGCGGYGGNITSDNITPRHLLNIKRLAYELRPAVTQVRPAAAASTGAGSAPAPLQGPPRQKPAGISTESLTSRIDDFLKTRGVRPLATPTPPTPPTPHSAPGTPHSIGTPNFPSLSTVSQPAGTSQSGGTAVTRPADFVCEDDVRTAIKTGTRILIGEKTIVTPSARDLGEAQRVFEQASWRP
jgi:acetaldehyde dehydrogenase (acetylating)